MNELKRRKVSELLVLAVSPSLPEEEARRVPEQRSFKEIVGRDRHRSYRMGVQEVPAFVVSGKSLVGAVPYEAIEKLLIDSGVSKRQQ